MMGGTMIEPSVDTAFLQDFLERSLAFSTPLTDQGESDPRLQAFLRDLLGAEMTDVGIEDVGFDPMGNVCGRIAGADPHDDGLLVVGYAMTHPAATMPEPFRPRVLDGSAFGVEGSVVVGRGAGEQKGPLASALAAFKAIAEVGESPRRDLYLMGLASGETGRHDAIRSALDHFGPRVSGCVIVVCTSNDVVVAHKGRIDLTILVKGKAAHSSSPWLGINAIDGARIVLERLATIDPGDADPELGPRSITPTSLRTGPRATHTVPSEAELTLDWRLLPGDDPQWAKGLLERALTGLDPYVTVVEAGDHMYPSEVDTSAGVVTSLAAAVEAVEGRRPELLRISAATDTGYVNRSGIPAVLFGPGDISRAHTDDDLVALDEAVDSARALARLMAG